MARTKADPSPRRSKKWRGALPRAPPSTRGPRRRINGKTTVKDPVVARAPGPGPHPVPHVQAPALHPAPHAQAPVPAPDAEAPVFSPGPGVRGLWPRKPFFLQRYYDRMNERKRCGNASSSSGVQGPGRVVPLDAEPWIMVDLTEEDDED